MSKLFSTYKRQNMELMQGIATTLIDTEGREYIDFTSGIGVANLGYTDSELNQALVEQLNQLWHTPNLYENQLQEQVATQLANGKEYLSYFCNSGAEANEAAIKLARKFTGRGQILTFEHSFHGRTYGAMSATAQKTIQEGFQPLVPDFTYLPFNELNMLKKVLGKKTAAVMLELIQGEGGVIPADKNWIKEVESLCQKNGTLLIIDEIQTGIGRTGTFYTHEKYGLTPDIFTLAKGLGNGFPVGAMVGKKELNRAFSPGSHGSTFGGNKLAMSVATKVIDKVNQPEFLRSVQDKSAYLLRELNQLVQTTNQVIEVRGTGLMLGVELGPQISVDEVIGKVKTEGVLTLKAGKNTLRLLPPLTITMSELSKGVQVIKECLSEKTLGVS